MGARRRRRLIRRLPPLDRLTVFGFLWAAAAIFEQAKWGDWAASPPDLALSLAAFWLLFRPWSLPALLAVTGARLWLVVAEAPWISNHAALGGFMALTILLAAALQPGLLRTEDPDREGFLESFAPAVRVELLLLYGWTVFHKLNRDWFDPAVSCGTSFADHYFGWLAPGTKGWASSATIVGTPLVELAIPLLLVFRRSRLAGLVLAVSFHLLIGAGWFYAFSALVLAALFLFAPRDVVAAWRARIGERPWSERFTRWWDGRGFTLYRKLSLGLLAIAATVLFSRAVWSPPPRGFGLTLLPFEGSRSIISYAFQTGWIGLGTLALLSLLPAAGKAAGEWTGPGKLFFPRPLLWVPVALVFLNGAAPYLGSKTQYAFSMFSNLRTEGERGNHLLVGRGVRLAAYQDDLVAIRSSSDPELAELGRTGHALPYFEFRSYVSRRLASDASPLHVVFQRGGVLREVPDASLDPELRRRDPSLPRKLLRFRRVPAVGPMPCLH